jgi:hypothetical protein
MKSLARFNHRNKPLIFVLLLGISSFFPVMADQGKIEQEAARCASEHSYDRGGQTNLGPHELAATERPYLDCIYEGMNKRVIPKALLPDDYRQLIKSYQDMTNAVEKGEITRTERMAQARQMLEEIKNKEATEREKRIQELDGMRKNLIRQQQMMQRTVTPRIF